MKARAAVEFVGGLVVKNNFSVALEAINGKVAIPWCYLCQKMELIIETLEMTSVLMPFRGDGERVVEKTIIS